MKISKEDQSLLSIAAGFSVITFFTRNYFFLIPPGIAVISYPFPALKKVVHIAWNRTGEIFGWISQRIILSVLYFFILTPIAFLRNIFGKESLQIKKTRKNSLFISRNHVYTAEDLKYPS